MELQMMFSQIKQLINNFLGDLTNMYKYYQIVYPLNHYQDILVRLLSPIQLTAFAARNNLQRLFENPPEQLISRTVLPHTNYNQPNQVLYSYQNQNSKSNMANVKRRSRGIEGQISQWVVKQDKLGRLVTRQILRKKAKQLGQSRSFKACSRWCDKFLQRNPQVYRIVREHRQKYRQKQRQIKKRIRNIQEQHFHKQQQQKQQSSSFNTESNQLYGQENLGNR